MSWQLDYYHIILFLKEVLVISRKAVRWCWDTVCTLLRFHRQYKVYKQCNCTTVYVSVRGHRGNLSALEIIKRSSLVWLLSRLLAAWLAFSRSSPLEKCDPPFPPPPSLCADLSLGRQANFLLQWPAVAMCHLIQPRMDTGMHDTTKWIELSSGWHKERMGRNGGGVDIIFRLTQTFKGTWYSLYILYSKVG